MSLYRKILWRFLAIALLPFLILAGFERRWASRAADAAAEELLLSDATAAAGMLDREAVAARATLSALVGLAAPDPPAELYTAFLESGAGPQPGGFRYLSIAPDEGAPTTFGDRALGSGCRDGLYSSTVPLSVPLEGGRSSLVGGYQPALQGSLRSETKLWVYDAEGTLVAATSCATGPGPPPGAGSEARTAQMTGASVGGFDRESVAVARVPSLDWTVVATGSGALRAPSGSILRGYGLFLISLAGTTLLALAVALRPVVGALRDLTLWAERVADGDLRPWLPTPTDDEVGRLTLAIQHMTDRLRATVTGASHSGRLAVLGKMSAYLAHEIRNPLSAVKMNLQRLERWRRAEGLSERYAETIEISLREVDRLSATVSNILQLSPNRPQPREAVSIHELITEVGRLLDRDFARRGVALRWDLSAKADRVLGVPGQLKGVIINLMLNALDAQPRGGRLLICSALVSGTTEAPGPLLELRFRDHGSGVPPEIRDRIFEPFFTTKERGSGIGLALASQTVADHGGTMFLDASSRVEEGAEFVIRLPLAAVVHAAASGEVEPQVAPWLQQ